MEGAILSGKLAARAVADQQLRPSTNLSFRQLTERPRDASAADANDKIPERTMYVAKLATTIPNVVELELAGNELVV
jgi:hypothetical protein